MINGNDVVLCDGEELISVLRGGQGMLNVLALDGVKRQLDEQIVDLGGSAPARRKAI